eukprot:10403368-Lingulodinium_polyedra.AAC.1
MYTRSRRERKNKDRGPVGRGRRGVRRGIWKTPSLTRNRSALPTNGGGAGGRLQKQVAAGHGGRLHRG